MYINVLYAKNNSFEKQVRKYILYTRSSKYEVRKSGIHYMVCLMRTKQFTELFIDIRYTYQDLGRICISKIYMYLQIFIKYCRHLLNFDNFLKKYIKVK